MPQIINLPGGTTATFPDGMPKEQIESVLQQHFKQSQAQPNQPQVQAPAPQPSLLNTAVEAVSPINAIGGGIQSGLSNIVGGAIGGKTGQAVSQTLAPPELVQEEMQKHPALSTTGELAGTIAPIIGATVATGGALTPILGKGALNTILSNTAVGAALSGDNRVIGGILGGTLGGIAEGTGKILSKASNALGITNKLKTVVNDINNKIQSPSVYDAGSQAVSNTYRAALQTSEELYNPIKTATFTPAAQQATNNVTNKLSNLLNTAKNELNDKQKVLLTGLESQARQINTSEQLLKFSQKLGQLRSKFSGSEATDLVFNTFKNLDQETSGILNSVAKSSGIENQLSLANSFYKNTVKRLQNFGADDISAAMSNPEANPGYNKFIIGKINSAIKNPAKMSELLAAMDDSGNKIVTNAAVKSTLDDISSNPEAVNLVNAKNKLIKFSTLHKDVLTQDSKDTINGIVHMLEEAGVQSKQGVGGNSAYFEHALGAGLGSYAGSKLGGEAGGITGAVIGIGGAPILIKAMSNMLETPNGVAFLKALGQPGNKQQILIREPLKAYLMNFIPELTSNNNGY